MSENKTLNSAADASTQQAPAVLAGSDVSTQQAPAASTVSTKKKKSKGVANSAVNSGRSSPSITPDNSDSSPLPQASSSLYVAPDLSALEVRISSLEEENILLRDAIDGLHHAKQEERAQLLADFEEGLAQKDKELLQYEQSLFEQRGIIEQVTQLYEAALRDRDDVTAQLSTLEQVLQSSKEKLFATLITTSTERHDGVANDLDGSSAERLEFERLLQKRQYEAELEELQQTVTQYYDQISELQVMVQEQEDMVKIYASRLSKEQSSVAKLNDELVELQEAFDKLQASDLQSNGAEFSRQLHQALTDNELLKGELLLRRDENLKLQPSSQEARIAALVASLEEANQQLDTLTEENRHLTRDIGTREVAADLTVTPYFITKMQDKFVKARNAILHLREELSESVEPTKRNQAVQGIIDCLESGLLEESNPEVFFAAKKDELNGHLLALRGITSLFNTAVNAILTVLAVFSIVGIPGLLLLGTLQNNKAKNGSEFAFCMFGAKQKAERDIHEVMQSMSLGA